MWKEDTEQRFELVFHHSCLLLSEKRKKAKIISDSPLYVIHSSLTDTAYSSQLTLRIKLLRKQLTAARKEHGLPNL